MAQRALPPGAVRRRTAFGLFDADGWTWASVKATFWFLVIIFLLGYLPDRAYYFTVLPTIDVGYNVISPVNWCSPENRGLQCPPQAGAIVPWDRETPEQLLLPAPRTRASAFNLAERLYVAGGETPAGATDSVLGTVFDAGNIRPWEQAPALPAPRSRALATVVSGVPYLIGGVDADGNPLTSVLRATIEEGAVSGWEELEDLELPVAVADASAVATVGGIYLFGGRVDGELSSTVYRAALGNGETPELQEWTEVGELPLPEARADATAIVTATFVYLLGGEGPEGVSDTVFFLALDVDGNPLVDPAGQPLGWGVSTGPAAGFALPEPRMRHMSFSNAGAIYVVGGEDPDGALRQQTYWAVPDVTDGTIAWRTEDVVVLPEGRADASVIAIGGAAFLIGGETEEGPTDTLRRSNLAPALPFFRLGLFGMTVPGLAIPGEIGQELGLILSAGAGTTMFVLLVIIGLAYSHPRATKRIIERVSRGRFRAPPEEDEEVRTA